MREQIQSRLEELKKEFEIGQTQLQETRRRQVLLRETLLRISGAIQVLEETLASSKDRQEGLSATDGGQASARLHSYRNPPPEQSVTTSARFKRYRQTQGNKPCLQMSIPSHRQPPCRFRPAPHCQSSPIRQSASSSSNGELITSPTGSTCRHDSGRHVCPDRNVRRSGDAPAPTRPSYLRPIREPKWR